MTEDEHDKFIGPLLLEACKKAETMGGTVICYSEYGTRQEDGFKDSCRTMIVTDATAQARLIQIAVNCRGNLDVLLFTLLREHKEGNIDISQTMLSRFLEPVT